MNHKDIDWPDGIQDGEIMTRAHDLAVLNALGGLASPAESIDMLVDS